MPSPTTCELLLAYQAIDKGWLNLLNLPRVPHCVYFLLSLHRILPICYALVDEVSVLNINYKNVHKWIKMYTTYVIDM